MNVNVNLIAENVIQIKSGITINADVSVENIICENVMFGILLRVAVKVLII